MDNYRLLNNLLKEINSKEITILQGVVTAVNVPTCTVRLGNITVSDVRLRASESTNKHEFVIIPKLNTPVLIGSLSGDLNQLAILSVDEIEKIIINGGELGGLINIISLVNKMNELITIFNEHIHTAPNGATTTPLTLMSSVERSALEDKKINH